MANNSANYSNVLSDYGVKSNNALTSSANASNYSNVLSDYGVKANPLSSQYNNSVGKLNGSTKSMSDYLDEVNKGKETEQKTTEKKTSWLKNAFKGEDADMMYGGDAVTGSVRETPIVEAQKSTKGSWLSNVFKGGLSGSASGYTGAERALYEKGQGARTAMYQEQLDQKKTELDRWQKTIDEEKTLGNDYTYAQNAYDSIKREYDALYKVVNENVQQEATKATSELSNQLNEKSATYTQNAKDLAGNTKLGNIATDLAVNGVQLGTDLATNIVMPGASTLSLGARAFGSAAQEAEASGANIDQQLAYGAAKAGVEVLTEKMFDGLAGVYGKGAADDVVKDVINKMATSAEGRKALEVLASSGGEFTEEVVSDILDPYVKLIYDDGDALVEKFGSTEGYFNAVKEELYDGLIGALMGGIGGTVSVAKDSAREGKTNTQTTPVAETTTETTQQTETKPTVDVGKVKRNATKPTVAEPTTEQQTVTETTAQEQNPLVQNNATTSPVSATATPTNTNSQVNTENATQTVEPGVSSEAKAIAQNADEKTVSNEQKPTSSVVPKGTSLADANIPNATGLRVNAKDRDNYGTIVGKNEDGTYSVFFRSIDGSTATVNLKPSELHLVSDYYRSGNGYKTYESPNTKAESGTPTNGNVKESQGITNTVKGVGEILGGDFELDSSYTPTSEKTTLNEAMNKVNTDLVGTMDGLIDKELWTATDNDAAMTIMGNLMADALENKDYSAVQGWARVIKAHSVKGAQFVQSFSKWTRTGAATVQKALNAISQNDTVTATKKAEAIEAVTKFGSMFDAIQDGDVEGIKKLIKELNDYRGTGTLHQNLFDKYLDQQTDFDYLKEFAFRQLNSIKSDLTVKPDIGSKLKNWQTMAQLFRLTTWERNIGGNATFGALDTLAVDGFGIGIDALVSKLDGSGKRVIGFDKRLFQSGAFKAMGDAIKQSVLEISADINMSSESAYNTSTNRLHKMSDESAFARVMSRAEQILAYALNTTDAMANAEVGQGYEAGLRSIEGNKLTEEEIQSIVQAMSDYRLFKNKGIAYSINKGIHDTVNLIGAGGTVKGEGVKTREGGFGIADPLMPYPGVPANLGVKPLEYSPLNIIKGGMELIDYLFKVKTGKEADILQRFQAETDIARGMAGTPIIACLATLFASGAIKYYDDEDDYDVMAQNAAEGKSGTLWNLSASKRALTGGDPEWQNDDTVINLAWIQPLNSLMAISYLVNKDWQDYKNGEQSFGEFAVDFGKDTIEGSIKGILDLPVMSSINDIVDTLRYSTADSMAQKVGEAGISYLGSAASGMIPAPVQQAAKISDPYMRDTRSDTTIGKVFNSIKNNIPGARQTLPIKLDAYGEERLNNSNAGYRTTNALINPGVVDSLRTSELSNAVNKVYEETGNANVVPERKAPTTITYTDDDDNSQKYKMTVEEQREYHKISSRLTSAFYNDFINSDVYSLLNGSQKAAIMTQLKSDAADYAAYTIAQKNGLKRDSDIMTLVDGEEDVSALGAQNLAEYRTFMSLYKAAKKKEDYSNMDVALAYYDTLSDATKATLGDKNISGLEKITDYRNANFDAETYYNVTNSIKAAQKKYDKKSADSATIKLLGIAESNYSDAEQRRIIDSGVLNLSNTGQVLYDTLSKYNLSVKDIADFFYNADYTTKDGVETKKSQDGSLTSREAASALNKIPESKLSHDQKVAIYNELREQLSVPYKINDWGKYPYDSTVNYLTNSSNGYQNGR